MHFFFFLPEDILLSMSMPRAPISMKGICMMVPISKKKMQNCVPKLESFVLSDSANQELSLCSLYKAACSELQVMFLINYLLKYLNLSFEFWRRSD